MIWLAASCLAPGRWPDPEPPSVACTIDEANGLRGLCEVRLARPGRARLVLEAGGEETRLFRSSAVATTHEIAVWGLPPETAYTWTALDEGTGQTATGTLSTGALPRAMRDARVEVEVEDEDRQVEAVLLSPSCMAGVAWMIDRRGRVVWWQRLDDADLGTVSGLAWTEDGTVLGMIARRRIVEVDVLGEVLLDLNLDVDFEDRVHHDLTRAAGHTYALHSHTVQAYGETWVADGVYVFGPSGALVDDLRLDGVFPRVSRPWMESGYWIREFPGAVDTLHANAVHVDPEGDVWISMRHLSSIARFTGGPGEEGFGELELVIAGEPESPLWEDADVVAPDDPELQFSGQHDPHLGDDGDLWMFDNRMLLDGDARAVSYALDEEAGTLEQRQGWDLGLYCPVQGTARRLPGGHVVVACASEGVVLELAPDRAEPVWRIAPRCEGSSLQGFPRALPVDLP